MKNKAIIITLSILLGVGIGYGLRSSQGWTAKMPKNDTPPTATVKPKQIEACTSEWTNTQHIVKCKMYDEVRINN